jgi:hypothetical protein
MHPLCRLAAGVCLTFALAPPAAAQAFRPLALPDGFHQRMAERERIAVPADERAEVVERASAELTATSYYNRPGATWDDYLQDWHGCALVTRGSRIPNQRLSYLRSPSRLSPRESGIGATIGGHLGRGDNLDELHDENRRGCLRARGWRRVTPDAAEAQRIAALDDAAFALWAAGAIGSADPAGAVEATGGARLPDSPLLDPEAAPRGRSGVHGAGAAPGPGEGLLVIAFRRPDRGSAGKSAAIALRRYDLARADLAAAAEGEDADGLVTVAGGDRQAGYELHLVRLPAGHYVIDGTSVDGNPPAESNCFGAPLIEIPAGQAVYGGDWVPYHKVALGHGKVLPDALVLVADLERARAALREAQPALAGMLQPAAVANGASYPCRDPDVVLDRWSLAGVAETPPAR